MICGCREVQKTVDVAQSFEVLLSNRPVLQCSVSVRLVTTVGPLFTKAPVHEQIFREKKSRMTNVFSDYEHPSWQQRQAVSISAGVSCWLTMAQYTFLLDFGLRTFRFTNGLQERIKFVNRGPNAYDFSKLFERVSNVSPLTIIFKTYKLYIYQTIIHSILIYGAEV
jgi:hypothetical protein